MLNYADMNVLVTRGAGFLGYHLCGRLLRDGYNVICLDDLSTGVQEHLYAFLGHERFSFIRHDVTRPIDLRVDRIFHLACPASPPDYQTDPIRTARTNVVGVLYTLDLARANDARVLQASTSEVYGDGLNTCSMCYVDHLIEGLMRRRYPRIAKARAELNWEPEVALRPGLEATIDYFQERMSAGRVAQAVSPCVSPMEV
jgi:nucleoside-diphosphate-sugar epimerase